MSTIARVSLLILIACSSVEAFTSPAPNVFASNGSASDTQAAINAAAEGGTIQLPAGVFTWSTQVAITKGIHLQGAGAGRIIARSTDTLTVGTGSKTLTIIPDSRQNPTITAGQSFRVTRTSQVGNFMEGTVTSYNATTKSLVLNVTSTGGSGTDYLWVVATPTATTINHGTGNTIMLNVTTSANNRTEISGIKFNSNGDNAPNGYGILLAGTKLKPTPLIHDCFFQSDNAYGGYISIRLRTNNALIYNCSFQSDSGYSNEEIHIASSDDNAWGTAHTMGTSDTSGKSNVYIENCDFHSDTGVTDLDDNAKAVFRYNLFNNSALGSHGADTSNVGMRHIEIYNNEFIQETRNGLVFNLNQWFFWRGGTGVVTDNIMPNLNTQDYGDKPEILMTVLNLWRNSGPYPCWGATTPGVQYPAPHQQGQGHNGTTTFSEPIYIWNNSSAPVVRVSNDAQGNICGAGADSALDYVRSGRDFFNDGTARPGYAKYEYPHPARGNSPRPGPLAPANLRVIP